MRFAEVKDINAMLVCEDSHDPPLATITGNKRAIVELRRERLKDQLENELGVQKNQGKKTYFAIVACREHGRKKNDIVGYTSWFYDKRDGNDVWGVFSLEPFGHRAQADLA